MPYDGFYTNSIVNEISYLIDSRIDKIHQPSRDEIYLFFKKDKKNHKILLCSNPSYPRVQLTENQRENPLVAPNFCMILRKYLQSAKLIEVSQINFDRILELKFESRDELGYYKNISLTTEIMGKHSNIILIDSNHTIIDCIKHIGCDINRYRELLPGVKYILPPNNEKINPLESNKAEFYSLINEKSEQAVDNCIMGKYQGISKLLAKEICASYSGMKTSELNEAALETISSNFFYFVAKAKSNAYEPLIFYKNNTIIDYYVFPLKTYEECERETFTSSSDILDKFYGQKGLKDSLKQKFNDIFKLITNLIDRNTKKLMLHKNKLDECRNFELWKIYGDILMANQYYLKEGIKEIELDNFYSDAFEKVTIPLDEKLSPISNAQRYYKKYAKEKTTIEMVQKQILEGEEEHTYLESIACNLENATDIETIEEIRRELVESGYIKKKKGSLKQQKSKPHHFKSSDGYDIYVGKNNVQNDFLTTKFADGNDIWMHTKNIPGSHVIIKCNGNASDAALLEGALLAAYYSKAKNSTGVPVDYTERKNVKKPNGAKPGMVIYLTNKTIYVNPTEEKISLIPRLG